MKMQATQFVQKINAHIFQLRSHFELKSTKDYQYTDNKIEKYFKISCFLKKRV